MSFLSHQKTVIITLLFAIILTKTQAGPENIAGTAKAKASTSLNSAFDIVNVNDGMARYTNIGEWASDSMMNFWGGVNYPWMQLDWDSLQTINKIVLFDRTTLDAHTAGGTLYFSDGTEISVTAIPNDGSPKTVSFPDKKVEWVKFVVTDGDGDHLGLSEIEVFPAPTDYDDYVSWVDPYIETTRGRYFYFVTGSRPFGMISAAPMTRNKNQMGGGYNYNTNEILGFPQVHGWMLSGLDLMPTAGEINPSLGEQKWKSSFSHEDEVVQPGYQKVFLEDYNIWVEQTTTDRVSFYRFKYTKDAVSNILVNLGGYIGTSTMTDAKVTKITDTEINGSVNTMGRLWGGPDNVTLFFVIQFDKPFEKLNGWVDQDKYEDITHLKGSSEKTPRRPEGWSYYDAPTSGLSAVYNVIEGSELQMKMSISYTSIANAKNNLTQECDHWNFDQVRKEAKEEWNDWLGKIEVKGGSEPQKIKFYTDLWHTLLGRHKIDDYSGDYPDYTEGDRKGSHTLNAKLKVRTLPKKDNGVPKFHMYNSDAFWLTQWNLNILWGLAWPEVLDEFSASMVQYANNGGLLPRGPNAGGYSYIMTGCPATPLIVSAYTKGILTKVDHEHAYSVMKKNHMPGGMLEADDHYIDKGYFAGNAGRTLEAAFQDWSLAQMAKGLKKKKDAAYFLKRSEGWKQLYNKHQSLIFPKDENGNWSHSDPLSGKGWIEANAWQATWSVSHDIQGLSALMSGNDKLCEKLNFAFEQAEPTDFVFAYGNGYVSYANQPGCSNAHVFNYAGKPWLSQYWVRKVNEQAYGGITPDKGYGGHDEDQGQMGGVSALMSMGLFSLRGTAALDPVYDITSPVFDEIIIKLDSEYYEGDKFIIRAYNNSDENKYIQKASLNGVTLNQFWFKHSDFSKGGFLELWLGPQPNKTWGTFKLPE
ncbi:GH92 family glycosyl hydrolase [Kriegella aquimaris]|uniref:Alpha-1,2-mannosidase, putative n=1 Tax=Kriegella aquimaris TaxID=192904 RepID=A0A1G9YPB3_9FLAO|nr:GH92 family glycosyl hydrolase [Kriegella aquimaris]SDN11019.1 alpha-1,2-mannosidase, putative [Kriegella aquimaris]